jgi:hypothetical protein
MEIRISGQGCPNCEEMKRKTEMALNELCIQAETQKFADIMEIMKYIMSTPACGQRETKTRWKASKQSVEKIKQLIKASVSYQVR